MMKIPFAMIEDWYWCCSKSFFSRNKFFCISYPNY